MRVEDSKSEGKDENLREVRRREEWKDERKMNEERGKKRLGRENSEVQREESEGKRGYLRGKEKRK